MGISAISGLSGYSVVGIYGNPNSVSSISKVDEESKKNNPLITLAEEPEQAPKVDDFEPLEPTTSMSTGGFADILSMQEAGADMQQSFSQNSGNAADAFNDAIGLMGFQNNLRDQLNGSGFEPFSFA